MNGTNDPNIKPDSEKVVDLIASGYDWTCPDCDTWEHEIQVTVVVMCSHCGKFFATGVPEHAYK